MWRGRVFDVRGAGVICLDVLFFFGLLLFLGD